MFIQSGSFLKYDFVDKNRVLIAGGQSFFFTGSVAEKKSDENLRRIFVFSESGGYLFAGTISSQYPSGSVMK